MIRTSVFRYRIRVPVADTQRESDFELEPLDQEEQSCITVKKPLPSTRKVSVILRIEKSPQTSIKKNDDRHDEQSVDKSSAVQFSVMSSSLRSLPELEPRSQAREVTLFNSRVPARFATLSRTKHRNPGSNRHVEWEQPSSIRHSKTFSSFRPIPVPAVILRTTDQSKVTKLREHFEKQS